MRDRLPILFCSATLLAPLVLFSGCGDSTDQNSSTNGTGGAGGSTTGSAAGGSTTSSGGAGAEGGAGVGGSGAGGAGANGSKCEASDFAICEGFEGVDDGAFPSTFGPRGDEWGEGVVGVASDDQMRGDKSLKVVGGNNGQHFVSYQGDLGALASHHYGRVFMKVAVPAPFPTGGVLHADFIEGLGPGPGGSNHNVRWGVVENTEMMFQWIYNVQPSNGAPEFGEGTGYIYAWNGQWQCIEWMYDEPSQDGMLWIDGHEIPIDVGANHAPEIPVFNSLGVGLANYQDAGDGFTVWFDELAYDAERIGCDN